eukprot:TRINITY_DN5349_c0_g1_i2.p1 TRINITY_DN5349_c0_g1~~TRINITY_DN5349_c0_g1_i2.p1  ORF type:complete len:1308 (+),score=235.32 TRINITY_DN5349_c0_g1_i2:336-3926(+)
MVRDLATGEVESMDEGATEVLEDFPPPVEQRSLADEEDEAEGKSLREASHVEESIAESSESSRAAKMLKSEARATLFEAARSGLLRPAVEKVSLSEELRMKARETLLGAACKGTLAQAVTILNRRRQQHAALAKMRTILEEAAVDGTLGDALDEVWKPQDAVQHDMVQTLAAASADGSLPAKVEDFEASQIASRAHSEAESESMDRLLLGKMRTVLEEAAHSGTLGGALDEIWGPRTVMQDMMQTLAAASVDDSLPTKLEEFQASRADTESQVNSETLESPLLGKMRGVLEDAACTGRLAEALDKLRNRNLQESVQHEMMQALAAASADGSLVCQIEDSEVLEVLSRAASKAHAYVSSRSASKSQAAVDDATLIPPGSVAESVIEVATEPPPPLMERASSVETEIVEGKSAPPAAEEVLPEIIIPVPCETSVDGSLAGEESVLEGIADPPSLLMERASLVESDIVEGKSAMPASEEELPEIIIPVPCETSVDGSFAGEESVLEGISDPPPLLMERASLVESDIVEGKSAMPASEEELPEIIIPVPCETSVDGSFAGEESVLEGISDPPPLLMERASLVESDIVEGKSAMPASEEELPEVMIPVPSETSSVDSSLAGEVQESAAASAAMQQLAVESVIGSLVEKVHAGIAQEPILEAEALANMSLNSSRVSEGRVSASAIESSASVEERIVSSTFSWGCAPELPPPIAGEKPSEEEPADDSGKELPPDLPPPVAERVSSDDGPPPIAAKSLPEEDGPPSIACKSMLEEEEPPELEAKFVPADDEPALVEETKSVPEESPPPLPDKSMLSGQELPPIAEKEQMDEELEHKSVPVAADGTVEGCTKPSNDALPELKQSPSKIDCTAKYLPKSKSVEAKAQLDSKRTVRLVYHRVLSPPPCYKQHMPFQRLPVESDSDAWSHVMERKDEFDAKQRVYHKPHRDEKLAMERKRRQRATYSGTPLDPKTLPQEKSRESAPAVSLPTRKMAAQIMNAADTMSRNGRLTITELQNELGQGNHTISSRRFGDFFDWLMAPGQARPRSRTTTRMQFKRFDGNHDGAISLVELELAVAEYLGDPIPGMTSVHKRATTPLRQSASAIDLGLTEQEATCNKKDGPSPQKSRSSPLLPPVASPYSTKVAPKQTTTTWNKTKMPLTQVLSSTKPRRPRPGLDFPMPKGYDMLKLLKDGVSPEAICMPIGRT